jgi:hypothetical protein
MWRTWLSGGAAWEEAVQRLVAAIIEEEKNYTFVSGVWYGNVSRRISRWTRKKPSKGVSDDGMDL